MVAYRKTPARGATSRKNPDRLGGNLTRRAGVAKETHKKSRTRGACEALKIPLEV